jgi:prophage maintenance system killer protein
MSIDHIDDPLKAAAVLAYRVTRAQGFAEGNKRTALLLARWTLDHNGINGREIINPDDRELADLLVQAAAGMAVEATIVRFFQAGQKRPG